MFDFMGYDRVFGEMYGRIEREYMNNKVDNKGVNRWVGSYCSMHKNGLEGAKMRFIDMYNGRCFNVFKSIVKDDKVDNVFIYSGKYGIVKGNEWGRVYDKFMKRSELEEMKEVVKKRFVELGVGEVVYYIEVDIVKRSRWYVDVIVESCKELGIKCIVKDVMLDEMIEWK